MFPNVNYCSQNQFSMKKNRLYMSLYIINIAIFLLSTHIQNVSLIQKLLYACRIYNVFYSNHMTLQQKRFFQICVFREYATYYEIKIFLIIWKFSICSHFSICSQFVVNLFSIFNLFKGRL